MPDKYSNFAALSRDERESYEIRIQDRGSAIVIVAPHAGGIEPGTSETCLGIACNDLSSYCFEGKKARNNADLHITSSNFDEPQCLELIRRTALVLTVHGERSDGDVVFLGGLHTEALKSLRTTLEANGFVVMEHANPLLQGHHAKNICNQGHLGAGVQLELSKGLRRSLFQSLSADGRQQPTPRFEQFCIAIRQGLPAI
ncbi:MAG: poly-gamma-glutamate hydrolase family protein [Pseudomonas sp.]|nr:poly-gamma-glutamate hydrolase family protein [Pseudomonas sp.]